MIFKIYLAFYGDSPKEMGINDIILTLSLVCRQHWFLSYIKFLFYALMIDRSVFNGLTNNNKENVFKSSGTRTGMKIRSQKKL